MKLNKFELKFNSSEYKSRIFITYLSFQQAINACSHFHNYEFLNHEHQNCFLNVQLEYDNFLELARDELKQLLPSQVQHKQAEVHVAKYY